MSRWPAYGQSRPTKKLQGQKLLRKVKLTKGELDVEMTRLWSNPGFEVLAVPGTSRITWMQILHIFFFVFSTSVKVN